MGKVASSIVKRTIEMRVEYASGDEKDYVAGALDLWRMEQFIGQPAYVALSSYSGQLALAYFVAKRLGHSFTTKGNDERKSFEAWLEQVVLVSALSDDEPPVPPGPQSTEADAGPLDGGSSVAA